MIWRWPHKGLDYPTHPLPLSLVISNCAILKVQPSSNLNKEDGWKNCHVLTEENENLRKNIVNNDEDWWETLIKNLLQLNSERLAR